MKTLFHTAVALLVGAAGAAHAGDVSFQRDVLPILSNNCFECHGPDENTRKAGLRLDSPDAAAPALEGGATSEVLQRVTASDRDDRMPPPETGKALSEAQIAVLAQWLEAGAAYETHWAFVKPERPVVPGIARDAWTRNPIDNFIAARLEAADIEPSPAADSVTLLRRVYLDLIGLPPSPAEVDAFVADPSPERYEAVIDELLASEHFGERWGRYWLDAARYADSNGYSIDGPRSIWPYRDWVITAFNENKPFDDFVVEQLAGDLLPDATRAQRVATGFHRNTMINQEGGIDPEEFRLEQVFDRVNTTGTVFLGLTMGCARCHTHKYDPIQQTEYYEFLAFFNSDNEPTLELGSEEEQAERARIREDIAAVEAELRAYLDDAERNGEQAEWENGFTVEDLNQHPIPTRVAFVTNRDQRDDEQRRLVRDLFEKASPKAKEIHGRIAELRRQMPSVPTTMVLQARSEPRDSFVFVQGDFTRKGDPVSPGVPAVLHEPPVEQPRTRLDLARWIVDEENPLTARVTVNRYWQRLFGLGIVETENDFGIQGTPPTHPELLDWLAVEFMESGWDTKAMLKLMVMSATYGQASHARPDLQEIDPGNRLLARQNRLRLDAEIIRDSALVVSGLFNSEVGGPGVHPPQPDGVMKLGQRAREWNTDDGPDRYRRGMYTYFWRGTPYPSLTVFDAPNAQQACTRRVRSNTPLQALTLLNDGAYVELAQGFADRLLAEPELDDRARIERAFRVALGRAPEGDEVDVLLGLLDQERASLNVEQDAQREAWVTIARAIINLDEFITRE